MRKESLETGAKFNVVLKQKAPTWLGRLFAVLLIASVSSQRYHETPTFDNTPNEPEKMRQLDSNELESLSLSELKKIAGKIFEFKLVRDTYNAGKDEKNNDSLSSGQTETSTQPQPTQMTQSSEAPSLSAANAEATLSRITGYYCQQVPGFYIGDGGGYCGISASGKTLTPGAAACGSKWSLGTNLLIEGYGRVECIDRGYLAWDQVDIWFPTNADMATSRKPDWAKVTEVE